MIALSSITLPSTSSSSAPLAPTNSATADTHQENEYSQSATTVATNANVNAPSTYSAVASASTPNIRGTTLSIQA